MCLGQIGRVVAVGDGGAVLVEADGRRVDATDLTPEEAPLHSGDRVVMHSGFVLSRLTESEADDALSIRNHRGQESDRLQPPSDPTLMEAKS
ncbi:HypC/HybG/HupF family hydrogenase formation chaperone [Demequina salsinemoris]|uniref:HypC/HybG/HupF family hydrogenase formation chaperone n=1 Tax=Demequina salsinemoris TaxID=577470 RepID=UPI000782EE28|nr:HypC/HybG/HupF family hydrogenase formation chaperone [Demequina salsinemoris]